MEPLINVVGLKKSYGSNSVLKNIEFKVYPKEKVVLIGPSGGGKSTLLRCLNRLEECEGEIEFEGKNIVSVSSKELQVLRRKMGMVFQQFNLFPHLTIMDNITLAPVLLKKMTKEQAVARGRELLKRVNLEEKADAYPAQLSGGQRQRVAAARALILNPGIILADEPTGALDSRNAKALMEKLSGLNRDDNTTILMVTHDSNAASFCKRILFIQDGRIFHELRRDMERESQQEFYERILKLMAQMGGGSANVL